MNKLLNHIPGFLKNKYFISFAAFCVIMIFLDKNSLFIQLARHKEYKESLQSKQYYSAGLTAERKQLQALESNPATIEKIAREKYLMKRDNEELFLLSEEPDPIRNGTKN